MLQSRKKPLEILQIMEGNYRILTKVYQQLHIDVTELFSEFINSLSSYEIKDMEDNIKANRWGINKITRATENISRFL